MSSGNVLCRGGPKDGMRLNMTQHMAFSYPKEPGANDDSDTFCHYAPTNEVREMDGESVRVFDFVREGPKVGAILRDGPRDGYIHPIQLDFAELTIPRPSAGDPRDNRVCCYVASGAVEDVDGKPLRVFTYQGLVDPPETTS
ncbi:hypothetical protein [Streptodolium elevatio]|uniref:Uncharacterized protein n=1 Tax=Streptodolium elevatio TaxID=3157996 RepID=A0ABV3D880_9ACTN